MYHRATESTKKMMLSQTVIRKSSFSAPRRWTIVAPLPPKVADSPEALCCRRMQKDMRTATAMWTRIMIDITRGSVRKRGGRGNEMVGGTGFEPVAFWV
jgi:hypothetical protein